MVFIVNSNDFQVNQSCIINDGQNTRINLKGFPTFYSKNGMYIYPINLWMNYLINIKKSKNINSNVRAIKRYWSFLEKHDYPWDYFPLNKALKPTYRYRNDNLLSDIKNKKIEASTASIYMLHVIKFYEWAGHEQLIKFEKSSYPFNYEYIPINNYGMMNHTNKKFIVRTTDLRIKVPNKNDNQSLNPLNKNEISAFIKELNHLNEEFKIHQLLQIQSGLRVEEACTFPLSLVLPPPYKDNYIEVKIGLFNGVATKYGKSRTIEISANLMHRMYLYSISERRYKKSLKRTDDNFPRLLLNKNGVPFTPNSIQQHFSRLRNSIRNNTNLQFNHRTHDLRSTYGTYKLAALLEYIPASDAMHLIMGWLGHENEKTTWKYIRYLNKEKIHQNSLSMLDAILDDALSC